MLACGVASFWAKTLRAMRLFIFSMLVMGELVVAKPVPPELRCLYLLKNWSAIAPAKVSALPEPVFRFGPGFQSRFVDLTQLAFLDGRLDDADTLLAFESYLGQLDQIRDALVEGGRNPDRVTRVIYPAAACDAAYPVRVFRRADTIALDNHPMVSPGIVRGTKGLGLGYSVPIHEGSYQVAWDVDSSARYILPKLLGTLIASVKGFRLRAIQVFARKGDWTTWTNTRLPAVHGIIFYDQGRGTPIRQYVHVCTRIENPWWRNRTQGSGKWAMLVKASQRALDQQLDVVKHLFDQVAATKGYYLEGTEAGDGIYRRGEITSARPGEWNSFRPPDQVIEMQQFGLGDHVYAFDLKPTDSQQPIFRSGN